MNFAKGRKSGFHISGNALVMNNIFKTPMRAGLAKSAWPNSLTLPLPIRINC